MTAELIELYGAGPGLSTASAGQEFVAPVAINIPHAIVVDSPACQSLAGNSIVASTPVEVWELSAAMVFAAITEFVQRQLAGGAAGSPSDAAGNGGGGEGRGLARTQSFKSQSMKNFSRTTASIVGLPNLVGATNPGRLVVNRLKETAAKDLANPLRLDVHELAPTAETWQAIKQSASQALAAEAKAEADRKARARLAFSSESMDRSSMALSLNGI